MEDFRRWAPLLVIIAATLLMQWHVARRLRARERVRQSRALRGVVTGVGLGGGVWMALGVPLLMGRGGAGLPSNLVAYLMAASLGWVVLVISLVLWVELARIPAFSASRRGFLGVVTPIAAAPLACAGYGFHVARAGARLVEVQIRVPGLHKDLDGLRLVQMTDIHFGPFLDARDLARAVSIANETRPHVALLTGDLVTRRGDDIVGCLDVLRHLRAEAGIYGCHGNHEPYAGVVQVAEAVGPRLGIEFLHRRSRLLRFGEGRLNLTGYYYQVPDLPYLTGAEEFVLGGALNVLLEHNPDTFPRAAEAGFDLMLSGHTHGGQLNLELARAQLNVARIFTPFTRGHYRRGGGQLYVSSGVGTIGVPMRIGAPPEVTLVRLCAV